MIRTIVGFRRDDDGDWVAELSCLHSQHVRHRPPFQERPWVLTSGGRTARLGAELACPLCDRAEMPEGLRTVRTAGPFDAATLPAGLRRAHRVADGTWGLLRVLEGAVTIKLETEPPLVVTVRPGAGQPIPPLVQHRLSFEGPFVLTVDFLVAQDGRPES